MTIDMYTDAARLRDVRFSYDNGDSWVLDGVNLDVRQGERLCLVGPNGSGKSTLAHLIAGLSAPDSGDIELLGKHVFDSDGPHADGYRAARRGIGVLFQNPADQIITTVVGEDVAFGPENLAYAPPVIDEHVHSALKAVEMLRQIDGNPTQMSGGQQQRVAIAGTLAMAPRMIVLDEPTAMLDTQAEQDVLKILDHLQGKGITIIHVTHKPEELVHADRILRISDGRPHEIGLTQATLDLSVVNSDDTGMLDSDGIVIPHQKELKNESLDHRRSVPSKTDTYANPAIRLSHVSMRYPSDSADTLHDFSMTVMSGETVAIMGRNGSGKSTLTRLLAALSKPSSGEIEVAGINLKSMSRSDKKKLRHSLGLVMQQPERQLFAQTVRQDVAYGPINQGLPQQEVDARVNRAMDLLGISNLADHSPFSLSGGQQRLTAIAGIIACDPSILILDEPTAGLDASASERIYALIRTLKAHGITIIMVTHSPRQARQLADRIIHLDGDKDQSETSSKEPVQDMASVDAATSNNREPERSADSDNAETRGDTSSSNITKRRTTDNDASDAAQPIIKHPSFIERLDPRAKLAVFIILSMSVFFLTSPVQLALATIGTILIAALSGLGVRHLFHSLRGFLAVILVMAVINLFLIDSGPVLWTIWKLRITQDGVSTAILYSVRFILAILLGIILLQTTTPTNLTDGFASLASPLRRFGLHTQEIALVLSLALRFLPTLANETRNIIDAQAARGGSIETGSPTKRIKALGAIIIPIFAGALRHSDNLSLALDARCYEEGIHRTHWHAMHLNRKDIIFTALSMLYLAMLLALKPVSSLLLL